MYTYTQYLWFQEFKYSAVYHEVDEVSVYFRPLSTPFNVLSFKPQPLYCYVDVET